MIGQNLLDDRHPGFGKIGIGDPFNSTEVQRSVLAKLTWRF